ncbi:MAG: ADP-ribosylglycohydrolase family protein [Spirulinaceae cyanobacterium RM2_2_10]|nr:ADP-ribosylglycohydrolase family protein [Spirulinaceae cyanobacterium SM2_1_0]NJO20597.1 ADP-ribosylglycohydrolase family protein [Spirulinaceae cyanobacterium RM2_2_10]
MTYPQSRILSGLMGVCVGDALGIPAKFRSRAACQRSPVTDMEGYGTYDVPPGTWSDDSALTFCLAEALCHSYTSTDELLACTADYFRRWYAGEIWQTSHKPFDLGATTSAALRCLYEGAAPTETGESHERSNGSGSLMRILPLAFMAEHWDFTALIEQVHRISRITHAHPRSLVACGIYVSIAVGLLNEEPPALAYVKGIQRVLPYYEVEPYHHQLPHFQRLLSGEIDAIAASDLHADGYVVNMLEIALWCVLNSSSYSEAVLTAINLGEDTDTAGAVTGGLAGLCFGSKEIPRDWMQRVANFYGIFDLSKRLATALSASMPAKSV